MADILKNSKREPTRPHLSVYVFYAAGCLCCTGMKKERHPLQVTLSFRVLLLLVSALSGFSGLLGSCLISVAVDDKVAVLVNGNLGQTNHRH